MVKVNYQHAPRYENPLAQKLGLRPDDVKREGKIARLLADLNSLIRQPLESRIVWQVQEANGTGALPLPADWREWPELTERTVWGTSQKHTWLVAEIEVPPEADGQTLVLSVSSNWRPMQGSTDPQCLAYLDGAIAQALDGNHTELLLAAEAKAGSKHLVQINAFTFDERPMVGLPSKLVLRDQRLEALYIDLTTSFEVAIRLPQVDGRRHTTLDQVESALYALDRRAGQANALRTSLGAAEEIAASVFSDDRGEKGPAISAFGHTHLDVAWLWRVAHVRDKSARTFASVLNVMDEFPEFVFMYNQSVLFHFLKQDYPDLWVRLKEKVENGQFEIEGAMWVEPDVNIASGEALIRQIMRGRQFQIDEFGLTPKSVWLPDTFGYSAALPQLLAKSGIEFFITSKISWNDTDRHPYDTFFWTGIDGTRIKAHLITTQSFETEDHRTIYNSDFSVSDILGTWKRYEPKALNDNVMMCFGYGDGGGGPTREMVQRGLSLAKGIPGAPRLRLEGLRPFLERLGDQMDARAPEFPVWSGELYLQYHRGTLTSVADNKANNRNAERAMRELELLSTMAHVLVGIDYPHETIQNLWDTVLINQFHDILPGTSIPLVNTDTRAEYAEFFGLIDSSQGPMRTALEAICPRRPGRIRFFNSIAQRRDGELVRVPEGLGAGIKTTSGSSALQKIHHADGSTAALVRVADIPPMGWAEGCSVASCPEQTSTLIVSTKHLENDKIAVRLDDAGEIISIRDKAKKRELLAAGSSANRLIAYEDKPRNYDAWDIDFFFEDKSWPVSDLTSIEVVETGPHRAAIRIERHYANSRVVQIVSLEEGSRQIVFDTAVDWHERQTLLKAEFPFDLNTSETRAEVQFSHVKRASHRNTSWDQAKFETSMHRWMDMSEPDFGVALLSDSKYGYDAKEQTVRLTLLKGPVMPDPQADLGFHHFRYALRLHNGELDLPDVVRAAEVFVNPVLVEGANELPAKDTQDLAEPFSFVSFDSETCTLETIKVAENNRGIVLRVFEHGNRRARARLSFGVPFLRVEEVDLMENDISGDVFGPGQELEVEFRPFEIKTLRVRLDAWPNDGRQHGS